MKSPKKIKDKRKSPKKRRSTNKNSKKNDGTLKDIKQGGLDMYEDFWDACSIM